MVNGKRYFFVGIGGSGMMPLAMIVHALGGVVSGSDRALDQGRTPRRFKDLTDDGIPLFLQDGSGVLTADQIVIASAAVEDSVPDIQAAIRLGCRRMSRAELNAELFNAAPVSIGIAGTSGKSTVTAMIAWILTIAGRNPTVMNGARMKNFARESARVGEPDFYVSEIDESDRSIALYRPTVGVINNVSLDHLPLDELRVLFGSFSKHSETSIISMDSGDLSIELAAGAGRHFPFGLSDGSVFGSGLSARPDGIDFDVEDWTEVLGGECARVRLRVPGRHNVANALAAITAARAVGVSLITAVAALATFEGLVRRLDVVGKAAGITVIDDFAHNPDKIAATLDALHAFPGRLLLLFQPHGFGPLKMMGRELAETFAGRMRGDDLLVMPDPVYQGGTVSREVGSEDVIARIAAAGRNARHVPDRADVARLLVMEARAGDRIVVMGARDDTLSLLAEGMVRELEER